MRGGEGEAFGRDEDAMIWLELQSLSPPRPAMPHPASQRFRFVSLHHWPGYAAMGILPRQPDASWISEYLRLNFPISEFSESRVLFSIPYFFPIYVSLFFFSSLSIF